MRIALCDDNRSDRAEIRRLLMKYDNSKDCNFEYMEYESGLFCFKVNGKVVMKHKLNEAVMGNQMYDVSISRQKEVIEVINDDIKKLMEVCKEYNQEMPTQIKIICDIKKNSMNAQAGYELYFSKSRKKRLMMYSKNGLKKYAKQN